MADELPEDDGHSLEGKGGAVTLHPGGKSLHVGFDINAQGVEPGADLLGSVTVHTDSNVAGSSAASVNDGNVPDDPENESWKSVSSASSKKTIPVGGHDVPIPKIFSDLPARVLKSLAAGMAFGQTGIPGGVFADKVGSLADSPFYAIGQLALSFVPTVGSIADARDAAQDAANGKWFTAALSGLGAIPLAHEVVQGEVAIKHLSAWKASLGGELAGDLKKVSRLVVKYIAPHMPDSLAVRALDITAAADEPASKLIDEGVSMDNIYTYAKDGNLGKIAEATESQSMVVGRTDLSVTQWANLVDEGHSPSRLKGLVKSGFTGNDIERLGQKGIDFKRAKNLHEVEDIPVDDVNYYVGHGNSLKVIKTLRKTGRSPEFIKDVYKRGSRARRGGDWYGVAHNYCNWQQQQESPKYVKQCRNLPTS